MAREKTFVFVDYEAIRQSTEATSVVTVPSAAARQGNLSTGSVAVDSAIALTRESRDFSSHALF